MQALLPKCHPLRVARLSLEDQVHCRCNPELVLCQRQGQYVVHAHIVCHKSKQDVLPFRSAISLALTFKNRDHIYSIIQKRVASYQYKFLLYSFVPV